MELKLLKQEDKPLLSRKKVNVAATFDSSTPSKKEVLTALSTLLKTKEELITLKHIYNEYGFRKAEIIAHVYQNEEDLKKVETINKEKNKKGEKTEEAPKEQQKEEVKKEEPKEEIKKEQPKAEVKEEKKIEDGKEEKTKQ
jgi:ribosomal protein S24E